MEELRTVCEELFEKRLFEETPGESQCILTEPSLVREREREGEREKIEERRMGPFLHRLRREDSLDKRFKVHFLWFHVTKKKCAI